MVVVDYLFRNICSKFVVIGKGASLLHLFFQLLSVNRQGEMKVSVETDTVSVSTHFQDLVNPTSSKYQGGFRAVIPLVCLSMPKRRRSNELGLSYIMTMTVVTYLDT